jgi:hypothetical protein
VARGTVGQRSSRTGATGGPGHRNRVTDRRPSSSCAVRLRCGYRRDRMWMIHDRALTFVDIWPCGTAPVPSSYGPARRGHRDGSGEAGPPVTREPDRGSIRVLRACSESRRCRRGPVGDDPGRLRARGVAGHASKMASQAAASSG